MQIPCTPIADICFPIQLFMASLVEQMHAAWSSHDHDILAGILAENVEYVSLSS